jgi:hypothetical protein
MVNKCESRQHYFWEIQNGLRGLVVLPPVRWEWCLIVPIPAIPLTLPQPTLTDSSILMFSGIPAVYSTVILTIFFPPSSSIHLRTYLDALWF